MHVLPIGHSGRPHHTLSLSKQVHPQGMSDRRFRPALQDSQNPLCTARNNFTAALDMIRVRIANRHYIHRIHVTAATENK